MRKIQFIITLLLAISGWQAFAQSVPRERLKDLRGEWWVSDQQGFRPFQGDPVKKIFFTVEVSQYPGGFLCLEDDRPFAVFIDRQLLCERIRGRVCFNLDSLGKIYSSQLALSVFQRDGIASLKSYVEGSVSATVSEQGLFPRRGNYFLDFSLLASLIIFAYLIFLLRTNPRLTLDYLNVAKLFTAQEREESLLSGRITSRVNLLFYLFCCLLCALILLVVFRLSRNTLPLATGFTIHSTREGFLRWIGLTLILAALLMIKLILLIAVSMVFNLRDKVSIQFFNFIRALFLAVGIIAVVCTMNFVFYGQYGGLDSIWIKIGAGVLILAAGMMYLKLLALTRYHFFHLFSYLCASEIIPLVILLKILLY